MATGGAMNQTQPPPGMQKPPTFSMPTGAAQGYTPPNVFDQSANALSSGLRMTRQAGNYQPTMVDATNVDPYMNPYTQEVINASAAELQKQEQMAQNTLDAQASAAGAYGGSRHGVAQAETAGQYADAQAAMIADLYSQGYTQAQQAAIQEQIANQNAGLAGAGLQLTAGGQMGSLSNLGFGQGMQITNQQATQGAQIQAMNQALIEAAKGQYAGFTGAPTNAVGLLTGTTGTVPYPTSQTQTQSYQPGVFDYMSLALGL